ncbi:MULTISPECIES: small-conductance mechanosensitive channel MscS [Tatumella]|uniref:Small-conductance mechanosensitive channel n=1 Tax=Tatumella punctata TaxID=399969 RepID=A0ABW1VS76_9GAMM|nr:MULTISPECIES: small-conductance mechanosensitive channel MscS [unclassified Tatumella]MBS0857050.1 small-conductance mechanosensitive channel MscS [Tatumella sp. JGM16]MBS0876878.1 small-conductance mechanosensitive channel MscS [Tatumella sp. JGM82]MBS0891908.1 small-conductance mechanosensitive channel MscS [Tatumella sp. JGM94]MBS0894992.1 small-conductance mechanosensitive channel MscS [Tatumella sp. JGM130]MBS0900582.1 small-conductance mechanosensitive channel MscS [Tatumella sp. JGM1
MQDINVVDSIHNAGSWLARNQELLLGYVVNIAAAIAILFFGFLVARVVSNALNKVLLARSIDQTVADFLAVLVRYGVIAFTLIAALSRVGVQTASVIAVLGAVGLAVGLSLQGSLSNLAAGVLLVTLRPFRVGEYVDINGAAGTVLSVQIFSTTLKSSDGKIIVVPNGSIISGKIINYSREPMSRSQFIIGVSYDADIDEVFSVLRKVVEAEPRVIQDKPIVVALNEMGASTLNIVVRCWTTYNDQTQTYWDLMAGFKRALDANNIGIPYPQMDVHIVNNSAPAIDGKQ